MSDLLIIEKTRRSAETSHYACGPVRATEAGAREDARRFARMDVRVPDLHELAEEVAGSLASAGLLAEGLTARALESIILAVERCLRGVLPASPVPDPFLEGA